MRERDIHRMIEEQNPELKKEIWERIRAQIDIPDSPPKQAVAAKPKRWKWAVIAMAIICVVTLSIVLPITLGGDKIRYCVSTDYTSERLGQTLGEYFETHNNKLLYVDWYDVAEETTTDCGHIKDNENDIIFFKEVILNGDTGESLIVAVTDNKTRVDIFDDFYKDMEEFSLNNLTIKWKDSNFVKSLATFEYEKHIYYLEIDVGNAKERLTEIIKDMLK